MAERFDSQYISAALASRTESRVILSEEELGHSARSILGHMEFKKCPLFNKRVSTEEILSEYIGEQSNIHLVRDDMGLSPDVDGVVIKKQIRAQCGSGQSDINLYLLVVSPHVRDRHERAFTVAHELGHIFLHSKLLEADLMMPRRSLRWHGPTNRLRPLMEAEANIFALYLLMPLSLLEAVYDELPLKEREHYIYYVRSVLERIFRSKVDVCMVVARLYLYQLTKNSGKICNRVIGDFRLNNLCKRGYSWITHGLGSRSENCDGDDTEEPILDERFVGNIAKRFWARHTP